MELLSKRCLVFLMLGCASAKALTLMIGGGIVPSTDGGGGGGGGCPSCITVNLDWGYSSCTSSPGGCGITSATRTLTVPGGNPGTIRLDSAGGTGQYKKNGGGFTNFSSGATIAVATSDTLTFKKTGIAPSSSWSVQVLDATYMSVIGEADFENTGTDSGGGGP